MREAAAKATARKREVTAEQRQAIEEAVSILVEDNRASDGALATCDACGRLAEGSLAYEVGVRLCGNCGTAYEIARIEGRARTVADYVSESVPRARRAS